MTNTQSVVSAMILAATGAGSAVAQTPSYTFEMRLIPDGTAGSPSGPWTMFPLSPGYSGGVTHVGFWLQARVAQTGGENWGIARAQAAITVNGSAPLFNLSQGGVNASGSQTGRGTGYRTPGGNELTGFDAYVGSARNDQDFDGDGDPDDNGDGLSENPWGVNGSTHASNVDGTPVPSDGTFSPWANLYRFLVNVNVPSASGYFTVNSQAILNGSIQTGNFPFASEQWVLQLGPQQSLSASYTVTWGIPAPAAGSVLAPALLVCARRRRR